MRTVFNHAAIVHNLQIFTFINVSILQTSALTFAGQDFADLWKAIVGNGAKSICNTIQPSLTQGENNPKYTHVF